MTTTSPAGLGTRTGSHRDAALLVLTSVTLAAVAAQFALAGFGAFSTLRAPGGHVYAAHMALGIAIGALAWIILAAVLASPAARGGAGTRRAAITLALLAVPVEPLLGEAGRHVPAVGALHAVTGLAIFALTAWLTGAAARQREAAGVRRAAAAATAVAASRP